MGNRDYEKDAVRIEELLLEMHKSLTKLEENVAQKVAKGELTLEEIRELAANGANNRKTMSEVAETLGIGLSALTISMNKLVKRGYVERERGEQDRRTVYLRLSEKSVPIVQAYQEEHRHKISYRLARVSKTDRERFIVALESIHRYLDMSMAPPMRSSARGMFRQLSIGDRVLPVAVFQGAMSVGCTKGKMAGAVACEGGMGQIAADHIGLLEEGYSQDPVKTDLAVLARELDLAKKILAEEAQKNPDKPLGMIGVNIPAKEEHYKEYVQTALEHGADAIISGSGLPLTLPKLCRGKDVLLIPIVSTSRAAEIIMKRWAKSNRLPDAFIFANAYAGGRLGYKSAQIATATKTSRSLITEMKNTIGEIPLIVAGGITGRKTAELAYRYGADAIQVGSLFMNCQECEAPDFIKEAYRKAQEKDVLLLQEIGGRLCRVLANDYTRQLSQEEARDLTQDMCQTFQGNGDHAVIPCGSRVWKQPHPTSVEEAFRILRGV